ncbi:Hypothetical protein LOCK908_0261 [Lacticaseibacillus rhamnosus LOCK908]|nr:hypothetical protein LRHK_263 [Lacticaseibacillus rhamnosus ATCC 8530]AGP72948.1 Hypothetical protein LOCK908_0261 [Lacticaseibacillus rhamnosus LOCK908]
MAKARPSRLRPLTLRLLTAPARAHYTKGVCFHDNATSS